MTTFFFVNSQLLSKMQLRSDLILPSTSSQDIIIESLFSKGKSKYFVFGNENISLKMVSLLDDMITYKLLYNI